MTNITDAYWDIGGTSLHTYASAIETLGGRDAPPNTKGEDVDVPYKVGDEYVEGVPGPRIIPLAFWVRDTQADGSTAANRANAYDDNWRALRNLLWNQGRQYSLTKRFRVGGTLRSATALVRWAGGLQTSMRGRYLSKFVVDLKLNDPYFYDDVAVVTNLVNGNQNVTFLGDADTTHIEVAIAGARDNIIIKNNTMNIQVQYTDPLLSGDVANIDIHDFEAITTPSGDAPFDSESLILHSGHQYWLKGRPGTNQFNLSSDSGTGAVTMTHRAAWL